MEHEAMALRWVDKLRHELESAHYESQDWVAEAIGARAVKLRAVERATAAEQKLDAVKAHLSETEAVHRKSLEALEVGRKSRSDAEREVVMLRGQMLGAEESNTRLLDRVTSQEEGISILESARLSTYLFCPWLMP